MGDLVGIGWRLAFFQLVNRIHALHDLADHGVFAIQERAVSKHDEELTVGGIVAVAFARHADHAARKWYARKLRLQVRIFRAAGAVAVLAVAGLCHESSDDTVEWHIVVKMLARELLQPLSVKRRDIGA
jgi:hypothetical protein